ncbi:Crp/Fnr family transcriptional regulator [Brevundimonas sp. GCM10030266]|uniref:Crp/Fnr family transcriptional regulator n=1 Tax=Brevundimonas sp. GCM10030266 TaxID=3273386 RepID=UPI003605BE4B
MTFAPHEALLDPALPEPDTPGATVPLQPLHFDDGTLELWKAFSPLAMERRRWALTRGQVEPWRAGQALQLGGEVAVIVAGAFAVHVGASGLSADILGPGDVLATGAHRPISGEWISDGRLYRTTLRDWTETAGVEGLSHLLDGVDQRRESLERGLACAARHLATERVADLLVAVQAATGLAAARLSQDRLGRMLGLRRTTVNASCRALQQAGVIRTVRGQIRIHSVSELEAAACGCRRVARAPTATGSLAS